MSQSFTFGAARKIAWREARASSFKFLFVILAVAVGVGALTGVRGFSTSFRRMLNSEARTLMAGDVSARIFVQPDPAQQQVLDTMKAKGTRMTQVTETVTMAAKPGNPLPVLVSLKAVDPANYPFYGEVKFNPPQTIQQALCNNCVVAAQELLLRLGLEVGGTMRIGGEDYRVSAIVEKEPDRMTGSLNVGPRMMMSRDALARTALLTEGSRAAQRFLFKLPIASGNATNNVTAARELLKKTFPDALITDYRETHPLITRGLDRATSFLSLVSLVALIIGALGVAMAMNSHLKQKLDNIAVMKCLGARSNQIISIYLMQTLALGGIGGILGILFGVIVQVAFPTLIERYFQLRPDFYFDWTSVVQGLSAGLLSTLLFTLPPLLSIREIKPNTIFRRDMGETKGTWRERFRRGRIAFVTGIIILLGLGLLAGWLAGSKLEDAVQLGGWFAIGLGVSVAILAAFAWGLLRLLRRISPLTRGTLRHGLANLYRPGNQAEAVLVSIGIGVMFTLTIFLIQHSILTEIADSAPPGMPNVFLIDITEPMREGVTQLVNAQPGVEKAVELVPSVAARITHIQGVEISSIDLKGFGRRFLQTRSITWNPAQPKGLKILQGKWYQPGEVGRAAISQDVAESLKLKPGMVIDWTSSGRAFRTQVAAVFRSESVRVGASQDFILDPEILKGLPVIYFAGVRVKTANVPQVQAAVYKQYPTVSIVNIADVLDIIQEVVDQVAVVIRFISAFAILGGVIILAASVAGTRFRRMREVVILKTFGGTRQKIARIFSIEFLLLGACAGILGSTLATGFTGLILKRFFQEADFKFEWTAFFISVLASALIANAAGWAASARILNQKPLAILRED
ncbi:ABC transporter permease [Bryobacter aggregatus]|uniref:ABC transporter permease n=1 Tax=Bryobacter aggregatus TaxID=360054 RepID=UPI0004E17AFB|nr:FtsX-like permease family protein [Bryobacter aggregatus]